MEKRAKTEDLPKILKIKYLAFQKEAAEYNDFALAPLQYLKKQKQRITALFFSKISWQMSTKGNRKTMPSLSGG